MQQQPNTNPMGRWHSMMGQHDAGCCVAGSVFPALLRAVRIAGGTLLISPHNNHRRCQLLLRFKTTTFIIKCTSTNPVHKRCC